MNTQFKVVQKTVGLDNNGDTVYTITIQPDENDMTGSFTVTTRDTASYEFFTVGDVYSAVISQ